jgi:hypothetical protein
MATPNLVQQRIRKLESEVQTLRFILQRKTGSGSADIKGNIVNPSDLGSAVISNNTVTKAMMTNDSVAADEVDFEQVSVTVSAGNSTGTATVTSGAKTWGFRPTGNQDQFIDNISISGTTLTITLAANATADNTFEVTLIKPT